VRTGMDAGCERIVATLRSIVSIPTVSDPSNNKLVTLSDAEAIRQYLPSPNNYTTISEGSPRPILLRKTGSGRPVTLLLAHYDVVPPGPGWTVTEPFKPRILDGKLYGRGSADDKSNVAAISHALEKYTPRRGTVIIAFTGDEEIGGQSAKWLADHLEKEGLTPDYVVNGDGSLSRVIIRRRAGFTVTVAARSEPDSVRGYKHRIKARSALVRQTMHSAYFIPGTDRHPLVELSLKVRDEDLLVSGLNGEWVKNNVIPRSAHAVVVKPDPKGSVVRVDYGLTMLLRSILPITRAPIPTEKYSDYGVSINPNVYKYDNGFHVLKIDIRAMTLDKNSIKNQIELVIDENNYENIKYHVEIRGGSGYLYTSSSAELVSHAIEINKTLGLPGRPIEAGGASDSRYFSPRIGQVIDYGPLGANIHGPDEHVYIKHLCKAAIFYRRLIERIHGGG